jgi:zinc/manganese transport system permease protein
MTDVLFNALLLSFVLLGIHAYFGMEVVRRGIIFTDIAIAQASAVGLALSLFLFDRPSYLLSLLCSLLVGVLILLSQRLRGLCGSLYRAFVCPWLFFGGFGAL